MFKTKFYIYEQENNKWCNFDGGISATEITSDHLDYSTMENFTLDETLDSGMLSINFSTDPNPILPYTICRLERYQGVTRMDNRFYCIYQDNVELTNLVKQTYTHTISLMEPIKMLERYLLPNNLAFTRTVGTKEYTIAEVIARCIGSVVNQPQLNKQYAFLIEATDKLNVIAPDFNFNGRNLFEALMMIGRYIGGIPALVLDDTMEASFFIEYTYPTDSEETDGDITSAIQTIEPSQYTGGFRSDIANMVVKDENASAITYPSETGFAFPRSEIGELLSNETMKIVLPTPIYKVKEVNTSLTINREGHWVDGNQVAYTGELATKMTFDYSSGAGGYAMFFKLGHEDVGTDKAHVVVDITSGVIEKTVYNALPTMHNINDTTGTDFQASDIGEYQDTSIPWSMGDSIIDLSTEYTYTSWIGTHSDRSINYNMMTLGLLNAHTADEVLAIVPNATNIQMSTDIHYVDFSQSDNPIMTTEQVPSETAEADLDDLDSYENFSYRIKYVPFIDGTVSITKNENPQKMQANQDSTIVDAEAWGKSQQAALYRTSLPTKEITKHWKTWPTIEVGDKLDGYYVVQENRSVGPFAIDSKYIMTKGYNRISQFTAIDSKWRESSIATTQITKRDYETNDFLKIVEVSDDAYDVQPSNIQTTGVFKNYMNNAANSNAEITVAKVVTVSDSGASHSLVMPVSSVAIGSTMRFGIDFKDYISAGTKQYDQTIGSEVKTSSQIVRYTDSDGYSKSVQTWLYGDFSTSDENYKSLPKLNVADSDYNFLPETAVFSEASAMYWKKDQREDMSIIHNIHCLRNENAGLTEYFAKYNPLITDEAVNHTYRWVQLSSAVSLIQNETTSGSIVKEISGVVVLDNGTYLRVIMPEVNKVVALIDEENRIMMYNNNIQTQFLIMSAGESY